MKILANDIYVYLVNDIILLFTYIYQNLTIHILKFAADSFLNLLPIKTNQIICR